MSGKILRIDLTSESFKEEETDEATCRKFLAAEDSERRFYMTSYQRVLTRFPQRTSLLLRQDL